MDYVPMNYFISMLSNKKLQCLRPLTEEKSIWKRFFHLVST